MLKLLVALVVSCGLAGCATTGASDFHASVTAVSGVGFDPSLRHRVVYDGAETVFNPVLQGVIDPTRRMLKAAGATLVDGGPAEPADVVVTVSFGEETIEYYPRTTREAVYAETGIASSKTVERVNGKGQKVAVTTYEPRYEIVGYREVEQSIRSPHLLKLKAYDIRSGKRAYWPLWSLEVRHRSDWGGEGRRLSYFLKAGQPYLGKLLKTEAYVPWNDPDIAYIRDGGPEPAAVRTAAPK